MSDEIDLAGVTTKRVYELVTHAHDPGTVIGLTLTIADVPTRELVEQLVGLVRLYAESYAHHQGVALEQHLVEALHALELDRVINLR